MFVREEFTCMFEIDQVVFLNSAFLAAEEHNFGDRQIGQVIGCDPFGCLLPLLPLPSDSLMHVLLSSC